MTRWLLASLMAFPAVGHATTVPVTFCVDYQLAQLADDSSLQPIGDDYFVIYDNDPDAYRFQPAAGAEIRVVSVSTRQAVYQGHAYSQGGLIGCVWQVMLDTQDTYMVQIAPRAAVGGHLVQVHPVRWSTLNVSFVPDPVPHQWVYLQTGIAPRWNAAALAAFALSRFNAFTGDNLDIYLEPCPTSAGACLDTSSSSPGGVYIGEFGYLNKGVLAHELGHWQTWLATGKQAWNHPYSAPAESCQSPNGATPLWDPNSKEYQGAAATEGFAEFYRAIVYNDHGPNEECKIGISQNQWDLEPDTFDNGVYSCHTHPASYQPPSSATDWMGEMCIANFPNEEYFHRATPYDYTRFFWDVLSNSWAEYSDLIDIWALSDPTGWPTYENGQDPDWWVQVPDPTHPSNSRHPRDRLQYGAYTHGGALFGASIWVPKATAHGVHR